VVERSEEVDNYRRELLGAVIIQYFLHAATAANPISTITEVLHCDNRGVISYGGSPLTALLEKPPQADLIHLLKHLVQSNTVHSSEEWVEGHIVESKGWQFCTLPEKLNYYADNLAKHALLSAMEGGDII
jgi:hypothetical protein